MLIRFYISIEGGVCTAEGDLGEFREAKVVNRTADMHFLDDMLMLKLNGPKTLAEFRAGQADSLSQLTPFSRDGASLWRQLFGARWGHYNAKATMAAQERRSRSQGFATQFVECWLPPAWPSSPPVVWPREGLAHARRSW